MTVEAVGAAMPQKKTGGSGKAWASVFVPGLGQFLDGRNSAGAGYLGTSVALGLGNLALQRSIAKDTFKAAEKATTDAAFDVSKYMSKLPKGKLYGAIALGLGGMALWIANIVDAYKGDRKKA